MGVGTPITTLGTSRWDFGVYEKIGSSLQSMGTPCPPVVLPVVLTYLDNLKV